MLQKTICQLETCLPKNRQKNLEEILVEVKIPTNRTASFALDLASTFDIAGFQVDTTFEPVPSSLPPGKKALFASSGEQVFTILVKIKNSEIPTLKANPQVVRRMEKC